MSGNTHPIITKNQGTNLFRQWLLQLWSESVKPHSNHRKEWLSHLFLLWTANQYTFHYLPYLCIKSTKPYRYAIHKINLTMDKLWKWDASSAESWATQSQSLLKSVNMSCPGMGISWEFTPGLLSTLASKWGGVQESRLPGSIGRFSSWDPNEHNQNIWRNNLWLWCHY